MKITTAVILAAGGGYRLKKIVKSIPKGFINLNGQTLIEMSLDNLLQVGVKKIIIVTGYRNTCYEELKEKFSCITTVNNPRFSESGTMYSLYLARNLIDSDFLLLESDLVYEKRALTEALEFSGDDCLVLSGTTKAGDEVYVDGDRGRVSQISKNSNGLKNIVGEFIGISKISISLFEKMIQAGEDRFKSTLRFDYDMDCINALAKETDIFYKKINDLLWGEIDNEEQLLRAQKIRDQILAKQNNSIE